jgi:hypothetical protein
VVPVFLASAALTAAAAEVPNWTAKRVAVLEAL